MLVAVENHESVTLSDLGTLPELSPLVMTILATYKCSAQCKECCFESSPHLVQRLTLEQILHRIDRAHAAFAQLEMICFSGGECFLLGEDLVTSIAHCTSLGIKTRCVTNGFWAASPERARAKVERLKAAGLGEINFSTGDEHQQFVPFETVVNGAIEAATIGIGTVIINEGSLEARFRYQDMATHPRLVAYLRDDLLTSRAPRLRLLENVWMSFHEDHNVTHNQGRYTDSSGCTNILNNIVATPDGQMASCCGLTMEHIPEMKIGSGDVDDFRPLHNSQLTDFLKIWIAVNGPKKILEFAATKDPSIKQLRPSAHICEACVQVYKTPAVAKVLREHFEEKVADVSMRFHVNRSVTRTTGAIEVGSPGPELVELRG